MNDQDIAFAQLTPSQITALRAWGTERPTVAGEVLFAEGATQYPFSVVLDGTVEILSGYPDRIQMVTVHLPGEFVGDADLLTGRASLVTARVGAGGRILEIASASFRRVIAELPDVSETLLSAFLMRRAMLVGEGYAGIKIVGSRFFPGRPYAPRVCDA